MLFCLCRLVVFWISCFVRVAVRRILSVWGWYKTVIWGFWLTCAWGWCAWLFWVFGCVCGVGWCGCVVLACCCVLRLCCCFQWVGWFWHFVVVCMLAVLCRFGLFCAGACCIGWFDFVIATFMICEFVWLWCCVCF